MPPLELIAAPSVGGGCSFGSSVAELDCSRVHRAPAAPPRSTTMSSKPVAELPPPKRKTWKEVPLPVVAQATWPARALGTAPLVTRRLHESVSVWNVGMRWSSRYPWGDEPPRSSTRAPMATAAWSLHGGAGSPVALMAVQLAAGLPGEASGRHHTVCGSTPKVAASPPKSHSFSETTAAAWLPRGGGSTPSMSGVSHCIASVSSIVVSFRQPRRRCPPKTITYWRKVFIECPQRRSGGSPAIAGTDQRPVSKSSWCKPEARRPLLPRPP